MPVYSRKRMNTKDGSIKWYYIKTLQNGSSERISKDVYEKYSKRKGGFDIITCRQIFNKVLEFIPDLNNGVGNSRTSTDWYNALKTCSDRDFEAVDQSAVYYLLQILLAQRNKPEHFIFNVVEEYDTIRAIESKEFTVYNIALNKTLRCKMFNSKAESTKGWSLNVPPKVTIGPP